MKAPKEKTGITTFEKQLEPFFKLNPYSKIQKSKKGYRVIKPWNDESLCFILKPTSAADLISTLNSLILPPRFTALYHSDSNTMEYIYTLLGKNDPYFSRQFKFSLDSTTYHCKFGEASKRLLILSEVFMIVQQQSSTDYRHLLLLREYVKDAGKKRASLDDFFTDIKPISFYISGFRNFDEATITEVSKHLNFFMQYYDRDCPYIIIHSIETEALKMPKQLQFIETTFPSRISTRRQEPFLLDLALVAITSTAEPRLQFLYYYQILEYAAFYYVDNDIKRHLLKVINTPDIQSNPDKYIPEMLDKVSELYQGEEAKLDRIVQIRCAPDDIWKEIQQNRSFFSQKQEFDGGHVMEPFISEDMTNESFRVAWHPKAIKSLRGIRNALVHGRERRVTQVISPTKQNDLKIASLVPLIRRIAEQIIIYGSVT